MKNVQRKDETVLVVGTQSEVGKAIKTSLEGQYSVVLVENGGEATLQISTRKINLILMDASLSIQELAEILNAGDCFWAIPIIWTTGIRNAIDKINGLSFWSEAQNHPFYLDQLADLVEQLIPTPIQAGSL